MESLILSDVSASYRQNSRSNRVVVLTGGNLRAHRAESIALRGPSGSGKSTLLSVIGGMMKPESGRVIYDQQSIYDLPDDKLSRHRGRSVGFLFQMDFLLPNYSVVDNLRMALDYAGYLDAEERIGESLEAVGLAHRANHLPDELSGGERHRAALARAIIHRPELILADEPTGNLDRENARRILDLLLAQTKVGAIVMIATHDDWVASHTDRTIHIGSGSLEEKFS